jgi:hypothetical protein
MAIKVTLGATENTQQEKPFPKLMKVINCKHLGRIVLMQSDKKGVVIRKSEDDYLSIGEYRDDWNMPYLTDYNEPITIQNL